MRYKNNVLDKLVQTDAIINKIQVQVNRNISSEEISESIIQLKEQLDTVREMVSIESDDFEQQFAGR
jgi:hypothetical protein